MAKVFRCPSTGGPQPGYSWTGGVGDPMYWPCYMAYTMGGTDEAGNWTGAGGNWDVGTYDGSKLIWKRAVRDWTRHGTDSRAGADIMLITEAPTPRATRAASGPATPTTTSGRGRPTTSGCTPSKLLAC